MAFAHGVGKTALDGAQANAHIGPGLGDLGRLAGILVSQRLDDHMGELLRHKVGALIDKAQHGTHMAAFLCIDPGALRAFTGVIPVHLRHREDGALRMR